VDAFAAQYPQLDDLPIRLYSNIYTVRLLTHDPGSKEIWLRLAKSPNMAVRIWALGELQH
jgi:hypothetical protein